MRSATVPKEAEVIRTYDGLWGFRDSFFRAEFFFLLLVGRRGLCKSQCFKERCGPQKDRNGLEINIAHYIRGNISPVVAYREAFVNRNKLLVFDDAERIWGDSDGRFFVRDMTETTSKKMVHWQTQNQELKRDGIPQKFPTTSRVAVILNRFSFGDSAEYDAIVDRAQFLYFDPPPLEIHRHVALWFWDQEVYDYIGQRLPVIDSNKLSTRAYVRAWERKPKGDWKNLIDSHYCRQSGEDWVRLLEADPKFHTVDERVAEFVKRTNMTRATYFNHKKSLKATGSLQPLDVP